MRSGRRGSNFRASPLVAAVIAAAVLGAAAAGDAHAHELRPAYLELGQTGPERWEVVFKVPARGDLRLALTVRLPEGCRDETPARSWFADDAHVERRSVIVTGGLAGKRIGIAGLEATLTDALVRVRHADGTEETHLLRPDAPSATVRGVAGAGAAGGRAAAYVRLGVEHILLGVDHLLFVLGLLLIVRDRWMLLKTITSFTLAHSVTLAIATLGYASAPVAPLNAAIALSILFLGPEVVRARRGETSLTIRRPWLVALAFGLLHGFGFASGLTTLGLPTTEVPLALLLFNVGVEAGQVAFVVVVIGLERSFRVLEMRWPRAVEAFPAYAVGTLGAFWTIERTAVLVWAGR